MSLPGAGLSVPRPAQAEHTSSASEEVCNVEGETISVLNSLTCGELDSVLSGS